MTQMQNSQCKSEMDEQYKIGKWFTGLFPCWVDAPSTLQAAHNYHGRNIVAIHLKDGGYRCCDIDAKEPFTFSLPEGTSLVEGWHSRESFWNEKAKAYDEALEKARECYIDGLSSHQPVQDILEYIFPELKESEDERIRKSLIDMLKNDEKCYLKEIAWLEKQGKKTIPMCNN